MKIERRYVELIIKNEFGEAREREIVNFRAL